MMLTIILTSDKTSWALRPFAWLASIYWFIEPRVKVAGYTPPDFRLPHGYSFTSLGDFADYPVNKWSNGLIKFLESLHDDIVLLTFDDFWVTRPVDGAALSIAYNYMRDHPQVARFDLTSDRLGAAGWTERGNAGYLDLIKSDPNSPYHFSYQAAYWRRELLLDCVVPDEMAWQSEINGDARLKAKGYDVIGTKQNPMKYCIAVQHGKLALDGGYQGASHALKPEDARHCYSNGWIPDNLKGGYA